MAEDRANTFLRMIRRAQRGRVKVYLGYCAGVGKTYQMLLEGHRLKGEGVEVVIGLLETHGRADVARLAEGLEIIPRQQVEYRGITLEEMDLEAILGRKPRVALIDELAHTNVPGSRNPKRYQDIQDILSAGIHVITTMNVQHLESLYNTVEKTVGVKVRERLPDSVLAEADQIVDVDLTPEDLRKRLEEGKIYPAERIGTALVNFFKASNLENLRELTLRELASQIDMRRRVLPEEESSSAPDQVMVGLSSRGPNSEKLLRYASRLAGRLNRNWYAVYVQTPSEEPTVVDSRTQSLISETLTLAKQLGAMVFTYKGEDVARTLLQFAKEYRVGHIVIGSPSPRSMWERVLGRKSMVGQLIKRAKGLTVTVLDTSDRERFQLEENEERAQRPAIKGGFWDNSGQLRLSQLISTERIVIWDQPVTKEILLRKLVETVGQGDGDRAPTKLLKAILEREEQGSTFFNEGAAFPHARINGLTNSIVSLGIMRQGIKDEPTEKPVELVFLILSPAKNVDEQIKILSLASRLSQNRRFRYHLQSCKTPDEMMAAISSWQWSEEQAASKPLGDGL